MSEEISTEDGWRAFIELCCEIQNPQEMGELFDLFFTYEEKEGLGKRYRIIKSLLAENLTQREIAEKMGVSISKITRGSNALKIINRQFKEALKGKMG